MRKGFLPILVFILLLNSCSNDLPLGGDDLPFSSEIVVDSLSLAGTAIVDYNDYVGNVGYLTVGQLTDPAYGDYSISTNIKPALISYSTAIDTISKDMPMRLRFVVSNTFGDTTAENHYQLLAISELWRATEIKQSDSLLTNPVVIADNIIVPATVDTFYVALDSVFTRKYAESYYEFTTTDSDSLQLRFETYNLNMFGFQLRPINSGSINMFVSSNVSLQIDDVVNDTTYSVSLLAYANTIKETNKVDYKINDYISLNSYNQRLMKFEVTVLNQDSLVLNGYALPTKSLSKVEIVFYEDTLLIATQRPATFRNIGASSLLVFEATQDNIADELLLNSPRFTATKRSGRFGINITSFINGFVAGETENDSREFYMTIRGNDGFFANTLLYGEGAGQYSPKVIVTYSKTDVK
jgi:hypothetical protein